MWTISNLSMDSSLSNRKLSSLSLLCWFNLVTVAVCASGTFQLNLHVLAGQCSL